MEDRFGVVLLCEPSLAEVVATLASSALALGEYARSQPSVKSRSSRGKIQRSIEEVFDLISLPLNPILGSDVEELASRLEGVAVEGLKKVARAFGEGIVSIEIKGKPAFGSSSDVASLLRKIVKENLTAVA